MDAVETLKLDVQEGRISPERLVDLVATQQRQLQAMQQQLETAQQQLQAANKRIEELERKLGGSGTAKIEEPFSMRAEEKRQEARGKKKAKKKKGRQGRFKTKHKIAQAERREPVYPEGVPPSGCYLSHIRPVWRLENRQAVLVAYE